MEITNKKQLQFYLYADRMMNRGKFQWSFKDKIIHLISPDWIMKYLETMRYFSYYKNQTPNFISKICRFYYGLKFNRLGVKLGFSIGCDCLGYAVVLCHYGTIVVGEKVRIGNFAVLHTSTCISNNGKVIGDCFFLATGAKITTKLNLGNNISVGANSLVNKSFEEDSIMIAGSPAKKIKDYPVWYYKNEQYLYRVQQINKLRDKITY